MLKEGDFEDFHQHFLEKMAFPVCHVVTSVRIIYDENTARKLTLEALKYQKVGTLPNPVVHGLDTEIPVDDVWKHGVNIDAVNKPEECCWLPQHAAFFLIFCMET